MIELTKIAAKKILDLKDEENQPSGSYLRIKVEPGHCKDFSYKMEFSNKKNKTDREFKSHGINILTDPQSFLYIMGLKLDYEKGLNGKGFSFLNPNATKTCGCGTSFKC